MLYSSKATALWKPAREDERQLETKGCLWTSDPAKGYVAHVKHPTNPIKVRQESEKVGKGYMLDIL